MIEFQIATPEDVKGIQHVLSSTWQVTYQHLKPETIKQVEAKWHNVEFLTKQIKNDKYYFPIALDGEKVVGIATSGVRKKGEVDLFRFYVLPEYQAQGIGTELLGLIEKHYPGVHKLKAYVDVHNQPSIEYYERRGFKKIKQEQEESFGEVMDEWLMEKELSK